MRLVVASLDGTGVGSLPPQYSVQSGNRNVGLMCTVWQGKAGTWLLGCVGPCPQHTETMEYYVAKKSKTKILFYGLVWKECQDISLGEKSKTQTVSSTWNSTTAGKSVFGCLCVSYLQKGS